MPYVKTTWVDGSAPAITAAQLNRIETGIDDAHAGDWDAGVVGAAPDFGTVTTVPVAASTSVLVAAGMWYLAFEDYRLRPEVYTTLTGWTRLLIPTDPGLSTIQSILVVSDGAAVRVTNPTASELDYYARRVNL